MSSAVALANLDIFEREGINDHVKEMAPAFRATLEKLYDLPIVGDVRGEGFFYGIELVKDKATKETFNDEECERLLRGFLTPALFEAGLYCRADDRGDPVVQLAPAADQRAEGIRRDLRDPARRAERSQPAPRETDRVVVARRDRRRTKPPIDPVRWHRPAGRLRCRIFRSADFDRRPVPGNAPEDVVVDADGSIWTGLDDGRSCGSHRTTGSNAESSPTPVAGRSGWPSRATGGC